MSTVKEKCKVVMLPCKNSNKGIYKSACSEKLHYFDKRLENSSQSYYLYILSDDEIKEGDWVLNLNNYKLFNCKSNKEANELNNYIQSFNKVIASTDSLLNLPKPSQSFIKKYCESNGTIDEVLVEYNIIREPGNKESDRQYDLKILKTNSMNEIAIFPIEEKIYTQEEVKSICKRLSTDVLQKRLNSYTDCNNWIEQNLK